MKILVSIPDGQQVGTAQVIQDGGPEPPEPPVQPPTNPPPTGGTPPDVTPVDAPTVNGGNLWMTMVAGITYAFQMAADADVVSYSAPGGFCEIDVGDSSGPKRQGMGGMDIAEIRPVKAGDWVFMRLGQGRTVRTSCARSALKYGN